MATVQVNPVLAAAGIQQVVNVRTSTAGTSKSDTNTDTKRSGTSKSSGNSATSTSTANEKESTGVSTQSRQQLNLVPAISGAEQMSLVDSIVEQGAANVQAAKAVSVSAGKTADAVNRAEAVINRSNRIITIQAERAALTAKDAAIDIFEATNKPKVLSDLNQQLTKDLGVYEQQQAEYMKDVTATIEKDGFWGWFGANLTMAGNYQEAQAAQAAVDTTKANITNVSAASDDTAKTLAANARLKTKATIDALDDRMIAEGIKSKVSNAQSLLEANSARLAEATKLNISSINTALQVRAEKYSTLTSTGTTSNKTESSGDSTSDSSSSKSGTTTTKAASTSKTKGATTGSTGAFDMAIASMEEKTRHYNIYARANELPQRTVIEMTAQLSTPGDAANQSNAGIYLGLGIQRQEREAAELGSPSPLADDFYKSKQVYIAKAVDANESNATTRFLARVDANVAAAFKEAGTNTSKLTEKALAQASNSTSAALVRSERANVTEGSLFSAVPLPILAESEAVAATQLYKNVYSKLELKKTDPNQLFELAMEEITEGRMTQKQVVKDLTAIFSYAALYNNESNRYERLLIAPQNSYNYALELDGVKEVVVTDFMSPIELDRAITIVRAQVGVYPVSFLSETPEQTASRREARSQLGIGMMQIPDAQSAAFKLKQLKDNK